MPRFFSHRVILKTIICVRQLSYLKWMKSPHRWWNPHFGGISYGFWWLLPWVLAGTNPLDEIPLSRPHLDVEFVELDLVDFWGPGRHEEWWSWFFMVVIFYDIMIEYYHITIWYEEYNISMIAIKKVLSWSESLLYIILWLSNDSNDHRFKTGDC